jgi:hypothetical protein
LNDEHGHEDSPFSFLLLFAPAIVIVCFLIDVGTWLVHPSVRYAPPEWLIGLLTATITAGLSFYVQREYVQKLEAEVFARHNDDLENTHPPAAIKKQTTEIVKQIENAGGKDVAKELPNPDAPKLPKRSGEAP